MNDLFRTIDDFTGQPDKVMTRDPGQENTFLHSVLNSLSEGIIVADQTGKFLYFNTSARKILGIGSENLMIDEWTSVFGCYYPDTVTPIPPDQLPLASAIRDHVVRNEIIFIRNKYRPDGIYISVSADSIKDKQGNIRGGTVIFRDITQQKMAENALVQSEARLRAQFNGIPIPTYIWKKTGKDFILIDYNAASEKISRKHIRYLKRGKMSEVYAHVPEILECFLRCLHETSLSKVMSFQIPGTDEVRDMIIHFVRIPPDKVLVHAIDVTEMKKNERDLRKLSNALEQTADSVLITDKRGTIEYINAAFEKTTGFTKEDTLGRTPGILKSGIHDTDFYRHLWNTISRGDVFKGIIANRRKGGELYWSEQTITPMKNENGEIAHYVSVLRDITQIRKQQEQEIQIQLAREVQSRLYKKEVSVPGLEISVSTLPAAETNGDYYDIIPMNEDNYGLVIGDVSGHGIGPALIMAQVRSYLHAFTRHESDPGVLLTWLNQELVKVLDETHFVTLKFIRIDPKRRSMVYASAGHIPGYLLDKAGEIRQVIDSTGIPIGFIPDYRYTKSRLIRCHADDILILLTDGIIETRNLNEKEFGPENVLDVVKKNCVRSPREIQRHLNQSIIDFLSGHPQQDDVTSLICKFNPAHSVVP